MEWPGSKGSKVCAMSGKGLSITIGILITLVMHGGLAAGYMAYRDAELLRVKAKLGSASNTPARKEDPLLCRGRRCARLEVKAKRRDPEPSPIKTPEVLDAALVPALGSVAPDPRRLPEIETFERPEVFEEAVNLSTEARELREIIKRPEAADAMKDPKNKETLLRDLLSDEPLDPRAKAKDLSRLTGMKEGEVGGQGTELRLGSVYSSKVSKEIEKVFKVPPFLDENTLKTLKVRIQISRMTFDGAIEEYRIVSKSGDKSYDDAAIAAIRQFSPKEGGSKRLPTPDPEVLRFINAKGLTLTLDGRLARR